MVMAVVLESKGPSPKSQPVLNWEGLVAGGGGWLQPLFKKRKRMGKEQWRGPQGVHPPSIPYPVLRAHGSISPCGRGPAPLAAHLGYSGFLCIPGPAACWEGVL